MVGISLATTDTEAMLEAARTEAVSRVVSTKAIFKEARTRAVIKGDGVDSEAATKVVGTMVEEGMVVSRAGIEADVGTRERVTSGQGRLVFGMRAA
jgi:hypothetical protein